MRDCLNRSCSPCQWRYEYKWCYVTICDLKYIHRNMKLTLDRKESVAHLEDVKLKLLVSYVHIYFAYTIFKPFNFCVAAQSTVAIGASMVPADNIVTSSTTNSLPLPSLPSTMTTPQPIVKVSPSAANNNYNANAVNFHIYSCMYTLYSVKESNVKLTQPHPRLVSLVQ